MPPSAPIVGPRLAPLFRRPCGPPRPRARTTTRALLALLLALWATACSDADRPPGTADPLTGFWGGYFPGSSVDDPRAGVEIHFERHGRNAFVHREAGTVHRATVAVERDGNDVELTLEEARGDVSTFTGRFLDADRIRGRFTNRNRGEDFALDLVRAESIGLTPLAPPASVLGAAALPAQDAPLAPHVTLQIDAATEDGSTYQFLFGLGWYFDPGRWTSANLIPNGPDPDGLGPATGPTAVLQLLFFPSWLVFDLYAYPSQILLSASLEVPLADFAAVGFDGVRRLTIDDSSFVGVWPYDDPATSVEMRWVETDDYYDRVGWPTRTSDPRVTISYDDKTYDVPANAADMLLGFSGVGLVTSTGSAAAPR